MQVVYIYYLFMVVTLFMGVRCMSLGFTSRNLQVRYRAGPIYQYKKIRNTLYSKGQDEFFAVYGIRFTIKKLHMVRQLILLFFLCLAFTCLIKMDFYTMKRNLIVGIGIYFLSAPEYKFSNRKTLLKRVLEAVTKLRQERLSTELTAIIMQMENLIISKETDVSAVYIIKRLLPFSKLSKNAFIAALSYLKQGETELAAKSFNEKTGIKLGAELSRVIIKLDALPPKEFLGQLERVKKEALDQQKTRDEEREVKYELIKHTMALTEAMLIVAIFIYIVIIDSLNSLVFLS